MLFHILEWLLDDEYDAACKYFIDTMSNCYDEFFKKQNINFNMFDLYYMIRWQYYNFEVTTYKFKYDYTMFSAQTKYNELGALLSAYNLESENDKIDNDRKIIMAIANFNNAFSNAIGKRYCIIQEKVETYINDNETEYKNVLYVYNPKKESMLLNDNWEKIVEVDGPYPFSCIDDMHDPNNVYGKLCSFKIKYDFCHR